MSEYSVIYTDCPFQYQNWTEKKNGAAKAHYIGLTDKELCDLPVGQIAAKDSVLIHWAMLPKLKEAIEVMEAWGFEYITTAFNWVKTYKDGHDYCGLGFYTRSGSEICLLGKKGKGLKVQSRSVRQVIKYPVVKPHSSKPPIVRDKIVQLFGDVPRIELFSRVPRKQDNGWVHAGYEVDGSDIRDTLKLIIEGKYI